MPLVSAKCTSCGASLEVDNTKDAAICPYCNTAYIVEKAINNYNITNNISANTVNIYNGSVDFTIRASVLEKYNGASSDVIIPNTVKIIGREAFDKCIGLKRVTIPETVTEIQYGAFSGCRDLESITIPDSVSVIGVGAFSGCSNLSNIILPNQISEIAYSAFRDCESLQHIVIPNSVTGISGQAFSNCTYLKEIIIPEGVTYIREGAFYGCKTLTKIVIPSTVEKIGHGAFVGCEKLTTVVIPEGADIAENAFKETPYWKNYCVKSKKGCYIATCVYGSYDCPQVWTLRRYRDYTLSKTLFGRVFVRIYYATSPTLVKWFGTTKWFRRFWRGVLNRWVSVLNNKGVADMPYEDRKW